MRALLGAELFWVRRRRALRIAIAVAGLIAIGLVVGRFLSTSPDVAGAIENAHQEAASARDMGVNLTAADTYQEPRYPLAEQLPRDLAGSAVALALIGLVAAALGVGGEWRTGTVKLSMPNLTDRVRPGLARVLVWWLVWTVVAAVAIAIVAAGLILVGHQRGLTDGLLGNEIALIWVRSVMVAGIGAGIGAALASVLRSDTTVIVLLLAYVLVAEIVVPGLNVGTGLSSPGSQLLNWVVSIDVFQTRAISCGQALRCNPVYPITAGAPAMYIGLVVTTVAGLTATAWAARRPIWR